MTEIADQGTGSDSGLDALLHSWEFTSIEHNDRKKEIFRYARQQRPVAWTAEGGGFWLVTRYDDVKTVLEDWETFSSTQVPAVPIPVSLDPRIEDPPFQPELRRLLKPLFARTAITRFESGMRELARDLIAGWIGRGSVELISGFCTPYICGNLAQIVFPGDGVIRTLLDAAIDGGPIPEDKLIGVLCILVRGLETTGAAIGSLAYRVATTPGLEDRLRDPGWIRRGDLDELLRLDTPITCIARVATRDTELRGVLIRAGERVQVRYDSANWDTDRFPGADTLVFDTGRGRSAVFGIGIHRCAGFHLARLQIIVAVEELLAKITNLRLTPDARVTWMPGNATRLDVLNLEFDRA